MKNMLTCKTSYMDVATVLWTRHRRSHGELNREGHGDDVAGTFLAASWHFFRTSRTQQELRFFDRV